MYVHVCINCGTYAGLVIGSTFDAMMHGCVCVVGEVNSAYTQLVSYVVDYYHTPLVTLSTSDDFTNKLAYPNMLRVTATQNTLTQSLCLFQWC